jgi:hypothetical protein
MPYLFSINKNDMKGGQSRKQKNKTSKNQQANMKRSQRMDNPRAAGYLSPWEIKVSGLPQADHKHNRRPRFKIQRVLGCIYSHEEAVWWMSGWLYSR